MDPIPPDMSSRAEKIPRESLGNLAYDKLREAIQSGLYKPGKRIREGDVADWLNMSRTPVREALRRLETEGLLVHEPHRGVVIAHLDHQMVMELYSMRDVLEGTAARLAAQHASAVEISALTDMVEAELRMLNDPDRLADHNRRFHSAIYHSAHNRYLLKTLSALGDSLGLLGRTTYAVPGRPASAHDEHKALVEAIADRDPARAEAVARGHIQASQRARLRLLFELAD
jgi:DNA-binding GntR family transcriptional regulator